MGKYIFVIWVGLAVLLLGGCVSFVNNERVAGDPSPVQYAREYLYAGRILEANGRPVAALRQYRLALTVNPESRPAAEAIDRLHQDLHQQAEVKYQQGMAYRRQRCV